MLNFGASKPRVKGGPGPPGPPGSAPEIFTKRIFLLLLNIIGNTKDASFDIFNNIDEVNVLI